MSLEEQKELKKQAYTEAVRYMENAADVLKKAGKEGEFYKDPKYIRMACGTAYNAVLLALDAYLKIKGSEKKKGRKGIEYYQEFISRTDKKLLNYVNAVYETLHLTGYYDGFTGVKIIQHGFEYAYTIIDKIKP